MVKDFWEEYHEEKVEKPKPSKLKVMKGKLAKRLKQPTFKGGKRTSLGGGGLGVRYRNPFKNIQGL